MSHIEMRLEQKSSEAAVVSDDSYLRKKFKKRDRSPSSSMLLNDSPPPPASEPAPATCLTPSTTAIQQKKEKQRPETWNKNEQQIFFNALRQNGKNFESITQYFNARQKRYKIDDGATVQRSKEQIRHFYYRTWHKIIKYISLPTTLKDAENQSSSLRDIQVNCLIAFNALMNKLHRWNKKSAVKLVELVNHGWTTVREKGKITRLRMPICKVSSKTIAVDSENGNQLPATIQVQLEPRNEAAYCRVHKLAQNPFLTIEVQTLQSVKFLIEFLENKWKNRRNQYMDKFQINDDQSAKSLAAKSSISDSETETNGEKSSNQPTATKRTQSSSSGNEVDSFSERLVLFPNETHQISNLDLYEASGYSVHDDQGGESDLTATVSSSCPPVATPSTSTGVQPRASSLENQLVDLIDMRIKLKSPLRPEEQDAAPLVVSAITPSTSAKQSTPGPKSSSAKQLDSTAEEEMAEDGHLAVATPGRCAKKAAAESKNARICYQLSSEQLRAGLTISNSSLVTLCTNKETKDLTFIQLYLALNKPKVISLKYDWGSSAGASTFNSLTAIQNQQQRFYIDTLASVASSYLNELQRVRSTNPSLDSQSTAASAQPQPPPQAKTGVSNAMPTSIQVSAQTSPTKIAGTFSSAHMPSSVAILQPNTGTTTVVPIDVMLKRLAEEQSNKTKKLLSDLNSKRRSRQRKPIMVVNSSNPPRTMLPKLSINGQQLIITPINLDMANTTTANNGAAASANPSVSASGGPLLDAPSQQQQQNIVYSGPVAAVVRQIVNPTTGQSPATISHLEIPQQQQQSLYSSPNNYPEMASHQSSKLAIPSFHQAYSNLMPQILNNLAAADSSSQDKATAAVSNEVTNLVSPPNLTDMSLLELSINNSDSLFGPSASASSNQPVVSTKFGDISKRDMISDAATAASSSSKKAEMDNSACVINLNDCSNLSNLSTLNNILNSLTCKSGEENSDNKMSGSVANEANKDMNDNGGGAMSSSMGAQGHGTSSGGFSLTHKRSEALLVEWTDSMNDVSLTGCFLNDLQSPEKPSKTSNIVHVLNENSRDSIFFNMDTIMDIIPPVANRYDESSLITSLTSPTLNNIGNSDS